MKFAITILVLNFLGFTATAVMARMLPDFSSIPSVMFLIATIVSIYGVVGKVITKEAECHP